MNIIFDGKQSRLRSVTGLIRSLVQVTQAMSMNMINQLFSNYTFHQFRNEAKSRYWGWGVGVGGGSFLNPQQEERPL